MEYGDVGGFQVVDVCVKIFIHMFEYAAILE
jgi:hypothetical protein